MNLLYKMEDAVAQAVSLICVKLWLWFGVSKKIQAGLCCVILAYDVIARDLVKPGLLHTLVGLLALVIISCMYISSMGSGLYVRMSNRPFAFYLIILLDAMTISVGMEWFYYMLIVIVQTDFPPRKRLGKLSFSGV